VCRLLFLAVAVLAAAPPARAAELFLVDEREIYLALDKLNAMGAFPGFLANTRPYDMKAVRAALDNNPAVLESSNSGSLLARWVALYSKDAATLRGTASLSWSGNGADQDTNDGVPTPEGFSGGLSALGRWEPLPWLSGHAKGTYLFSGEDGQACTPRPVIIPGQDFGQICTENGQGFFAGDTAVEFGHKYLSLQAGLLSTWYGPGRRGALVLTNNAQPYPGIRLHNPVPIPMPWIFSFLGNLQYDFFLARLDDKTRPVPESCLSGMRVAVRPSVWLEVGLSRAVHFGGKGSENACDGFWDAVFSDDYTQQGGNLQNNLAGFDVEVTLPFEAQPLQVYFEMVGEDQQTGEIIPVPIPEKWGYLGGVFLPAILGSADFDLRVEYATNSVGNYGTWWYTHPAYPHDYEGRVLGHPMGTDAEDIFIEGHWFFLPTTYLGLKWNGTTRNFGSGTQYQTPGTTKESTSRLGASFTGWFTKAVRAQALLDWSRVKNEGGTPGKDANDFSFGVSLSWQYSGM
jgi:hypothetical protein